MSDRDLDRLQTEDRQPTDDAAYLLGTNEAELLRLDLQHRLWSSWAYECWERAGIGPGSRVLDFGCGPGYTSLDLASLVAPTGHVLAIDESQRYVDFLLEHIANRRLANVEVRRGDAQHVEVARAGFDVVYMRWLLCYLPDPGAVIRRAASALRPGGALAVQDYVDVGGQSLAPPGPAHSRVVQVMEESWRQRGGDTRIGLRLPTLMGEHGLVVEGVQPIQRLMRPGTPAWMWPSTFYANFVPLLVEQGLLTDQEQRAFQQEWRDRSTRNDTYFWAPPMIEIIARKRG